MTKNIHLRKGTPDDIPELLNLIKELATYEREPDAVVVTEEILLEDGFGDNAIFDFLVAEKEGKVQGKKDGLVQVDEKAKAEAFAAEKAVNEARIAAATPAQEEE